MEIFFPLLCWYFFFCCSVSLQFFIFDAAINKWNVCVCECAQNAYYYFCIYFALLLPFFHRIIAILSMPILQIYMNIRLECLSFVLLHTVLRRTKPGMPLALIRNFIIKYLSRNTFCCRCYYYCTYIELAPALFSSFIRYFDEIFHLCCDL